jgi:hypothetical protein
LQNSNWAQKLYNSGLNIVNFSWKKVLSGLFATAIVAWACLAGGLLAGIMVGGYETVGVLLIWNSDDLGGSMFPRLFLGSTPGWMVIIGGWVALLFPLFIVWYTSRH